MGKPAVNRPGDLIKERSSACLVGLLSDHWCSAGYQLLVAEHGLVPQCWLPLLPAVTTVL